MFGFAGAHRTGKTTLANLVAEDQKMTFHDASVSKIMREAGINAVGDVPLMQRVEAQEFLLKRFLQDLQKVQRPAITDRTPLDMIGYMLGEVTMHNTDAETGKRVHDYMEACLDATVQHFDSIIIVRPLDVYVVDPKSPPLNLGYQDVVQLLIEGAAGLISNSINISYLNTPDLAARREISNEILKQRMAEIVDMSAKIRKH